MSIEQTAFNMFKSPSTDEYKRHIIDVVKTLIDDSPRITVNKLKSTMETQYFTPAEDVEGALSALLNVYCCISSFKVPGRDTTHLNPKKSELWDQRIIPHKQTA